MNAYEHTQPGTLLRILLGLPLLLLLATLAFLPPQTQAIFIGIAVILGLALVLFHALTVAVDAHCVRLRMGVGLIRIQFQLREITRATPVRNDWTSGWGIRILENGYLYNVSGLEAVEIALTSGATHRIGTDDPAGLARAIHQALSAQRS